MTDINKLRGLMAERGITQGDLAKILRLSEKTVSTRLKTGIFKSNEIEALMQALDISDPKAIFFT